MNSILQNWKTSSTGLLTIIGAIVHLWINRVTLSENDIMISLTGIAGGVGLLFAHDGTNPPSQSNNATQGKLSLLVLCVCLLLPVSFFAGCAGTTNKIAYQTATATNISVESALAAYDLAAQSGKTTQAQNLLVKNAWLKYQKAFLLACDAGKIGSTSTNLISARQSYFDNASQAKTDFINLIISFGVKINNQQK